MDTICLFKVTVKGFVGDQCKTVYVVSDSMDDAYWTYRNFLDEEDLGFESNRELEKVELVAKFYESNERGCEMLFISNKVKDIIERRVNYAKQSNSIKAR